MANPVYTPYYPLNVAKNLRFINSNGILVTEMYPIGTTNGTNTDTPETGYISLIGSVLSQQIDNYTDILGVLSTYNTDIITLQGQVLAIQTSGATAIPQVNGACLNGNSVQPINVITTLLVSNTCAYNTVLGTPTSLNLAILAEGSGTLNTQPAFSQNSTMSGLSGWITSPITIADSINNSWIAYKDARSGITNALAAITPTCAQVKVEYQAVLIGGPVINLYFSGYTFIPTGFIDNGSTVQVTDTSNNKFIQSINIVTLSTNNTPLSISTSGNTLSPTSTSYTVQVNSSVINSTLGISCQKTVIKTVNTAATSPTGNSYDVTNYNQTVTSGTTSIVLVSGLSYTPRAATVIPKDSYNAISVLSHAYFLTYTLGGVIMSFSSGISVTGTGNIDCITFK